MQNIRQNLISIAIRNILKRLHYDCVNQLFKTLLSDSPNAITEAKCLVWAIAAQPLTVTLIADTVEDITRICTSAEGRNGVRVFLEKRKSSWLQ